METSIKEGKNQNNQIEPQNNETQNNDSDPPTETIIDLGVLAGKSEIRNSDIILAIFEICTFNKKYKYDCSNNTKAFWERVVVEDILKKIFRNFKSETLRKYWKLCVLQETMKNISI